MKKYIIGFLILCGILNARMCSRDAENGVVNCWNTNLMWQDDREVLILHHKNWAAAIVYCENLTLAGYSDWHLPTVNELISIIDFDKEANDEAKLVIDDGFKHAVAFEDYVSSTTTMDDSKYAFIVSYRHGITYHRKKDRPLNMIRCVRVNK